jgi:hypothetical protein
MLPMRIVPSQKPFGNRVDATVGSDIEVAQPVSADATNNALLDFNIDKRSRGRKAKRAMRFAAKKCEDYFHFYKSNVSAEVENLLAVTGLRC